MAPTLAMSRVQNSPAPSLLAVSLRSGEVRYVDLEAWHGTSPSLESISGATGKRAGPLTRDQVVELIGPVSVTLPALSEPWRRSA